MSEIKILRNIECSNPAMIAGWPGMGSVALGVVDYLRKYLDTVKFAEIRIDPMSAMDSVEVEKGVASLPRAPRNSFYYSKRFNLIIFEGESQMHGLSGVELANNALTVAERYKVSSIYTGAAFPMPISHKEISKVFGVVNRAELLPVLSRYAIEPMDGGGVSGLNGLLIGFAKERKMDAVCLLAVIPQYAISIPNPKASRAIIEHLERMLKFSIEIRELDEYVKEMDEKMSLIEDNVKDAIGSPKDFKAVGEEAPSRAAEKRIPAYILDRIEKLFTEAKHDRAKAVRLKMELDRWNLYTNYEDRFLDLFTENQ